MQYSEVKKICDDLHKTGKPVSLDYLISQVPGAQASLVVHYQKWRNEQANVASTPTSGESMFSEDFVTAFQRESQLHAKKLTDQLNQQLQQAMQAEILAAEHNRELQLEVEQLQQRKSELESSLQQQQQQLSTQAEKYSNLSEERDQAQALSKAQQLQLDEAKAQLTEQQAIIAQAEQELMLNKATLEQVQQQFNAAQQEAEQAKNDAEQLQLKLIAAQQAQDELEEQLQNEQQLNQQKLQQLQSELASAEQELEPLQAKVKAQEQLEQQVKLLEEAKAKVAAELDAAQKASKKTLLDLQTREHDVTELQAMLNEFENKLHQATKTETQAVALTKRLQAQLEQAQRALEDQEPGNYTAAAVVTNDSNNDALILELTESQQQLASAQRLVEQLTAERDQALSKLEQNQQQEPMVALETNTSNEQDLATIAQQEQELDTLNQQLTKLNKELDHIKREAEVQRDSALKAQEQLDAMQNVQSSEVDDSQDIQATLAQLRNNNAMLKEQSAITANHQSEQREVIRQLREELQQQRDLVADIQLEKDKLKKERSQLEQQVSFVKDNAAATIERLTRYREQAQEKIEKLEKKLNG